MKVKSLGHVRLSATPWTAAHQAPPSVDFPGESTGVGAAASPEAGWGDTQKLRLILPTRLWGRVDVLYDIKSQARGFDFSNFDRHCQHFL